MKIILVNPDKCSGCRSCAIACAFHKERENNLVKSRMCIMSLIREGIYMPVVCYQCDKLAYCQQICPTRAITRDAKEGIVRINFDKCIGCRLCLMACPFGAITWDTDQGIPIKCDLCNGDPECIKSCESKAIQYVEADRSNLIRMRENFNKFAESHRYYISVGVMDDLK